MRGNDFLQKKKNFGVAVQLHQRVCEEVSATCGGEKMVV